MKRKLHALTEDYGELPKGSIVQIIEAYHVNRETKQEFYSQIYTAEQDVLEGKAIFCYSARGYILVPARLVKEI